MGEPSNQMVDFPACATFDDYRIVFFIRHSPAQQEYNKETSAWWS